jgi:hypothetical protein
MQKKSPVEEPKPSEYFREVKAAQKQEKPPVSNLVTALRTDMVPSSKVQPARESVVKHENIKVAVGILLGLVIVGLILFLGIGPGRPTLENGLASLADREFTPTSTFTTTTEPATKTSTPTSTQTPQSPTSSPFPTLRPTNTQVLVVQSTATPIAPSATEPGCRDALSITLADVGQTLCVKGTVIETINDPSGFMVIFSTEPGSFYWVSYDWAWTKAKKNTCYQITGEIYQMGLNPILLFGYHNQPEVCS